MKIVHAKYHAAAVVVPIRGEQRVQFEDHKAAVADDVAIALSGMGGGFYTILAEDLSFVKEGDKVLLIRDTGLGDVLMLTPLIRRLHEDRGVLVDVLTEQRYRCLFDGNEHVNATFALEDEKTDRSSYAYVLDLRLVVENAEFSGIHRHRADAFAEYADITLHGEEDRRLDYFVTPEEVAAARERFTPEPNGAEMTYFDGWKAHDTTIKGVVGYVWSTSTANRNWSDETHYQVLAALLAAGYQVAIFSADRTDVPTNHFADNIYNFSGCLSIRETAAIMNECDAILTPDTGLFHLAGALGKPTVTYFGAFPVEERHAHRLLNVINDAKSSCALAPCRSYRCLNCDEHGQARCLSVDPGRVVERVNSAIAAARVYKAKQDCIAGDGSVENFTDALEHWAESAKETTNDVIATGLGGPPAQADPPPSGRQGNKVRNRSRGAGPRPSADDLGPLATGDGQPG